MMRRLAIVIVSCASAWTGVAQAQFGRGSGWATGGSDAQRSYWIRADAKISPATLQKPGFALAWKVKVQADSKASNSMAPPSLMDGYIGYRGFRSLGFVSSGDHITGLDTDLGRIEWQKALPAAAPSPSGCAGVSASITRPVAVAFPPSMPAGRGGGGRGGPAHSGVGKPGEGAVTIQEIAAASARAGAGGGGRGGAGFPGGPGGPGRAGGPAPGGRGPTRNPIVMHVLSSDGMFHTMFVSNGEEPDPAVKFLPPGTGAEGLIVVDKVAYAVTQGCGGAPNGVSALDLDSKEVANWKPASGGVVGSEGAAFGPDGTLYVATDKGELVALEAKTLKMKDAYRAEQGFVTSPVIFEYKDKTLIAAASKDGHMHLLDAKALGSGHPAAPSANAVSALASWQDAAGTRWVLGRAAGAVVAWKVAEQDGAFTLQQGWVSRDLASPVAPMILNGVVFTASGGNSPVLYALDGATGKELWNSGKTIAGAVRGGGISAGGSQVYLGTYDGTLYAFAFPIEH